MEDYNFEQETILHNIKISVAISILIIVGGAAVVFMLLTVPIFFGFVCGTFALAWSICTLQDEL